jgi:predicted transcriptional regulator
MDMYLKEAKSGQAIAKELGIPRSTVYFYIQRNTGYDSLDFTKRNFRFLINRSKHLESVVSVLQESR